MEKKIFRLELVVVVLLVIDIAAVMICKSIAAERQYDSAIEQEVLVVEEIEESSEATQEVKETVADAPTIMWDYNIDSVDLDAYNIESSEDYQYLLMVLTGECQTESFENQILYGSVVLNRKNHWDFPSTIKKVCNKNAYACFADGNAFRDPSETSKQVAKYLLENGSQIPENVVYQAEFFQGSGVWKKVGKTYFCYY